MDNLPTYYESPDTMYHILEDNDSGVGVDELPFAAYSSMLFEPENPTPLSNKSLQRMYVTSTGNLVNSCHDDEDGDDEDENDLEYIDDEEDDDYRPNKTVMAKKVKGKLRKSRHLKTIDVTGMFTPPKKAEAKMDSMPGTRHYAHKDRTPRTILKMMEKHRESERVRHHTLNESMKNICSRIPGYDPNAKETKVIQMQRIIGYECYLENTINNLCENIGIKKKMLGINTNFITEALKDRKPEDWYKIPPVELPVTEDEDSLQDNSSIDSTTKYARKSSAPRQHTKYRREKISSPTVDSTTDNIIQLFPGRALAMSQPSETSLDGSWMSQGFKPIQESQESGIKTETQSTVGDAVFHDTIESLFEQELCSEPENLKTVTATFMKDDVVPSSTSVADDGASEFNLSSPIRYNANKVFLHSPTPSGLWQQPTSLYYNDASEILGATEMTSVSPEFILETRPKLQSVGWNSHSRAENSGIRDCNFSDLQTVPSTPPGISTAAPDDDTFTYTASSCCETIHTPGNHTGNKNKRKRYTPVRAPFKNISNVGDQEEGCYDNEKCTQKVVKIFKHNIGGVVKDGVRPPLIVISTKKENNNSSVDNQHQRTLSRVSVQDEIPPVTDQTPLRDRLLTGDQPSLIDHRRTTWMNGFMMFSKMNRSKFISMYPGLQSSHIQRIMGEAWRNLSAEAQQPYREKAKKYSQCIKKADWQDSRDNNSDRLVPSSTTDDLESIIAGL